MITWSISTKPCPIITWDGVVFNGEHHYVDHIYYMIHVRPLGLQCSEAISVYTRLIKFNPSIPHVQICLATVVFERRAYHTRSSCVTQHEELSQRCILGENTYTLKFSKGSSYNATAVLSNIRCTKDKHHMQSKYVTWYDHHHLVLMISITEATSWSPSPPAWHLDLHRSVVVVTPTIPSMTITTA